MADEEDDDDDDQDDDGLLVTLPKPTLTFGQVPASTDADGSEADAGADRTEHRRRRDFGLPAADSDVVVDDAVVVWRRRRRRSSVLGVNDVGVGFGFADRLDAVFALKII